MVEWASVAAAGKTFVYAKATEGAGNTDPYFHDNWNGIKQAGLLRGAYHFFHADQDATAQANNFVATLAKVNGTAQLNPGDLPATLDLEITSSLAPQAILEAAKTWLGIVGDATGRTPILYTYSSFWNQTLGNPKSMTEHLLWVARYTSAATPGPVGGWPSWTLWQHASAGSVDGIGGSVDLNVFCGSADDLNSLAGIAAVSPSGS
ncbi:glycoside hydrolase family 25 protein [Granulicella arctica]|uniref:glycoside hydrolase family 25 protein n=1 Tax=Granulicella arctica TaxID=940613 RepID=UPI0021E07DE9|nr:GH25 family lysozyme [Granulicella arctica]